MVDSSSFSGMSSGQDGEYQNYVMSLFRDYVDCASELETFLLGNVFANGRGTTYTKVFERFYVSFTRLYRATRPRVPDGYEEVELVRDWLKKSVGVLSKNDAKSKKNIPLFMHRGCDIAERWVQLLSTQNIIKMTRG